MAVHASPDAPAVDLLVDNVVAGTGLAFPGNTDYLDVAAGTRNLKVRVSGTTTTVIDADVPVSGGENYTVFASDVVANLGALVLTNIIRAEEIRKLSQTDPLTQLANRRHFYEQRNNFV